MSIVRRFAVTVLALGCFACSSAGPGNYSSINGADGENGKSGDAGAAGEAGVNGANGSDGINGTNGINGDGGKDGTDNRIVKVWKCDFVKKGFSNNGPVGPTTCTDTAVDVYVWYYAAETAAGDVFVRAGVDWTSSIGAMSTTRTGQSSSYFWQAGSYEANNGSNWLLLDICSGYAKGFEASGNWAFSLNKQGRQVTAKYIDTDVNDGVLQFVENCQ